MSDRVVSVEEYIGTLRKAMLGHGPPWPLDLIRDRDAAIRKAAGREAARIARSYRLVHPVTRHGEPIALEIEKHFGLDGEGGENG